MDTELENNHVNKKRSPTWINRLLVLAGEIIFVVVTVAFRILMALIWLMGAVVYFLICVLGGMLDANANSWESARRYRRAKGNYRW